VVIGLGVDCVGVDVLGSIVLVSGFLLVFVLEYVGFVSEFCWANSLEVLVLVGLI
jgi:hypothetical protein